MKCTLKLKDVGGILGTNEFSFESGKVTKIIGSNASGNSSILKGLISVLATPKSGAFVKYGSDAERIGIKGSDLSVHEGFVNIYAESAEVNLSYNGFKEVYSVEPDGKVLIAPDGNEKFLLTGVVMDNSRVVQQLKSGENSSFDWLIDELSFADNYEKLHDLAKIYFEEIETKKSSLISRKSKANDLSLNLTKLEKDKQIADKERQELSKKVSDSKMREVVEKRDEKVGQIERARNELKKIVDTFNTINSEVEHKKKRVKEGEKTLSEIQKEIASLNLTDYEKRFNERKNEVDAIIPSLKDEKSKVDGTINIFQSAKLKLHKDGVTEIECILCGEGKLNAKKLDSRLNSLLNDKRDIETKIQALTNEISKMYQNLQNLTKAKEEKEDQMGEIKSTLGQDESSLKTAISKISAQEGAITEKEKIIQNLEIEYNNLKSLAKGDLIKKLDELESKSLELQREIGRIEERIKSTAGEEDIYGEKVDLDKANIIYDKWLKYLSDLEAFTNKMYIEHREDARKKFNENIDFLIKELGFKGFKSIWLNNEDRLMVERENEQPQPVGSLSLSEKCTVAILLQLSMKEAYLPDIPFFLIDDILQDFDEDKKIKIINYLDNVAKEKDMFVLMSWLDEGKKGVVVG